MSELRGTSIITGRNVLIKGGEYNLFQGEHGESKVELGIRKLKELTALGAFHDSRERSKEVKPDIVRDIVDEWLSRLRSSTPMPAAPSESSYSRPPSILATFISRIATTHTSEDVLKDVFSWLYDRSSCFLVMWVHDERRDQTSLVAQVVAEVLQERRELTASFFSSNCDPQNGDLKQDSWSSVVPTLAYQVSQNIPESHNSIGHSAYNASILRLKTEAQLKKLIVEPLAKASERLASEEPNVDTRLIVIHGLEDLKDEEDDFQSSFLHAISQALRRLKTGSYSHKLLLLGRQTDQLKACLLGPMMHALVLRRPIMVNNLSAKAEELKRWEKELSNRERELGQTSRVLFEHQQTIQQWEQRLRLQEEHLVHAEEIVARREEDMQRKQEELRKQEKHLFDRRREMDEGAARREELRQKEEAMLRLEEERLQETYQCLLDTRREMEVEAAKREEDMKRKEEELKRLEEELHRKLKETCNARPVHDLTVAEETIRIPNEEVDQQRDSGENTRLERALEFPSTLTYSDAGSDSESEVEYKPMTWDELEVEREREFNEMVRALHRQNPSKLENGNLFNMLHGSPMRRQLLKL